MNQREDLIEADRVEEAVAAEDMDWREVGHIARDYLRRVVTDHATELALDPATPSQICEYLALADSFFAGQGATAADLLNARVEAIGLAEDRPDRDSNDAIMFDMVWRHLFDDIDVATQQDPAFFLMLHTLAQVKPSFAHDYASYFIDRVKADYPQYVLT